MSNGPLTSKTVVVTLTAHFEGDYIPKEDVVQYLDNWLDSGLDDRDDLVGWTTEYGPVTESPIEEEN